MPNLPSNYIPDKLRNSFLVTFSSSKGHSHLLLQEFLSRHMRPLPHLNVLPICPEQGSSPHPLDFRKFRQEASLAPLRQRNRAFEVHLFHNQQEQEYDLEEFCHFHR